MHQLVIPKFGLENLTFRDVPEPVPGLGEVLVEVKAASLNYRDLLVAKGLYNPKMPLPRVLGSDAAGVVIGVGEGSDFEIGDRVCGTFFQDWLDGPISESTGKSSLGGGIDGILAQQVVLAEKGVVKFPEHLSFEEAATLPCAALTAWNALTENFDAAGKTILLQGTGGVSIFALQFAKAMGAKVLITSGSNEKLAKAIALGATAGVNYRTNPDWDKWAKEQTGGAGVDLVVEVGGAGTLERSVKAVRAGGTIALIGVLAGGSTFNPLGMMMKGITLRGIFVGSRAMFEAMSAFISQHSLKPVIDRVFPFAEAPEAFRYLESGSHFGKVVLSI